MIDPFSVLVSVLDLAMGCLAMSCLAMFGLLVHDRGRRMLDGVMFPVLWRPWPLEHSFKQVLWRSRALMASFVGAFGRRRTRRWTRRRTRRGPRGRPGWRATRCGRSTFFRRLTRSSAFHRSALGMIVVVVPPGKEHLGERGRQTVAERFALVDHRLRGGRQAVEEGGTGFAAVASMVVMIVAHLVVGQLVDLDGFAIVSFDDQLRSPTGSESGLEKKTPGQLTLSPSIQRRSHRSS